MSGRSGMCEVQGRIVLDGLDCAQMGLHDLRRSLSIIPQESFLFTGTVRSNLDPFDEHQDIRLWAVLSEVQLDQIVRRLPGALSAPICDGAALSVGQKQLLCLARAMLRNSRVVVMDEATANCDPLTDELIQRTVRRVFADCTIITIAHRLQTIMDADRVLVMDAGRLIEFDQPALLLARPDSLFAGLVRSAGPFAERHLRRMALEACLARGELGDENERKWLKQQLFCDLDATNQAKETIPPGKDFTKL